MPVATQSSFVKAMKALKRKYSTKTAQTGSLEMSIKKTLKNRLNDECLPGDFDPLYLEKKPLQAGDVELIGKEMLGRIRKAVLKSRIILTNASHLFEVVTRLIVGLFDSTKV